MPTLARFYGIIMRMYFLGSEHNPPHVHAIYGEDTAAFDIRTGEMIEGGMPSRAAGMIREWIAGRRSMQCRDERVCSCGVACQARSLSSGRFL